MYGWIIDRDHIADEYGDDTGTFGPRNIPARIEKHLKAGEGIKFRMYDNDGILYYSGRLIGSMDEYAEAPLFDFGMPNAGAVRVDYRIGGKWEVVVA